MFSPPNCTSHPNDLIIYTKRVNEKASPCLIPDEVKKQFVRNEFTLTHDSGALEMEQIA